MTINKKGAFTGGIHPTDGADKALSATKPLNTGYIPGLVRISMLQSPSGICEPTVQVGDHVERGEQIAKPVNFTAVKLHASVSGTVQSIETEEINSKPTVIVSILPDKIQPEIAPYQYAEGLEDISAYSADEIISVIEDAGLCGMGGAGFPTHVKFNSGKKIDYVLINASECESYLTCDYKMMLEYPKAIINGANLFLKAAGANEAIICMEDNKTDCAEVLIKHLSCVNANISVKILPTRYPQGGERQLIQAVCNREVPAGGLPADVGVIVCNVQTAKAAADAVFEKTPLISRAITVTGCVKEPQNFLVPLGTPVSELVKLCGGITESENRVIFGGPMTGPLIAQNAKAEELKQTVTKVSGGLLVLKDEAYCESECIRCNSCAEVCPAGLTPWKIDFSIRKKLLDECEKLYATECIACGACSFICPAKRELTYHTALARDSVKAAIRERGKK